MTKYTITDIDWDTSDYDSCDPCDPNVPDLPSEILIVADEETDEDEIGDAITSRTSFCVNGFSVTETPDADEDEFDTVIYL